jgi:hypothetical protein
MSITLIIVIVPLTAFLNLFQATRPDVILDLKLHVIVLYKDRIFIQRLV